MLISYCCYTVFFNYIYSFKMFITLKNGQFYSSKMLIYPPPSKQLLFSKTTF